MKPSGRVDIQWAKLLFAAVITSIVVSLSAGMSIPASAAVATQSADGVLTVQDSSGRPVPGITIVVRAGSCSSPGTTVWRHTTGTTGRFSVTLTAGSYCVTRDGSVPAGYEWISDTPISIGNGTNDFAILVPRTVRGAIVAKDAVGASIAGVEAVTTRGSCASPGIPVWRNITQQGGYGVSLAPGTYCTTVLSVPADFTVPQPVQTTVSEPGPAWITLWTAGSLRTPEVLPVGTIVIVGSDSRPVPGVSVLILRGSCPGGQSIWLHETDRTGKFAVSLQEGDYCVTHVSSVPSGYEWVSDVPFTVSAGTSNLISYTLPRTVSGAIVAKDVLGTGIGDVTATTRRGSCATTGANVWRGTTGFDGYAIDLSPGVYCTTTSSVPPNYLIPAPVETLVATPGPVWITLWLPSSG